jgi:hypothetical protein
MLWRGLKKPFALNQKAYGGFSIIAVLINAKKSVTKTHLAIIY